MRMHCTVQQDMNAGAGEGDDDCNKKYQCNKSQSTHSTYFMISTRSQSNWIDITTKQACFAGGVQTLPNATPPTGKIPPIQQNCRNFSTSNAIWMPFGI